MNNLKEALENVMQRDVERYENEPEHGFSPEFERKMAALSKRRPRKMHIGRIFAAAAAAAVLFATGTLAGAVSSGFNVTRAMRYSLPAKMFTAVDTEGCPTAVETAYILDGFPMNQISISDYDYDNNLGTGVSSQYFPAPFEWDEYNGGIYAPKDDELYFAKVIHLDQSTKQTFKFAYTDMDYVSYKTLAVNGGQAYFITRERYYGMEAFLIWESEEYIFKLSGSFSEERAVELANSLVVYDGEIPYSGLREV